MARGATKKQSKATTTPAAPATPTTATSSSIPEPFVPVPSTLRPLTSTLPTDHVYTVHIDATAVALKKRVYIVPILMNLVIVAILAVRVYYAAPVYLDQIITIFGYDTAWKVHPKEMQWGDLLTTITNRTFLLFVDYSLFGFLGSWPWEFAFGSKYSRRTGAWDWRSKVGFQDTEIIVRKGRKWDTPLFSEKDEKKTWSREDELMITVKVEAALRKNYTSKTGYLLLDRDWDLDFKGMIDAHRLVKAGRLSLSDLDHIVLVHYQKQWLLWRMHENEVPVPGAVEQDESLNTFKNKLTALGVEDIFYRWIEIVQYETSLPRGFTQKKKDESLDELRRLLTARKIDFDKFLEDVGGRTAIPGLN